MGRSSFSTESYTTYRSTIASKHVDDVFVNNHSSAIFPEMNPFGLKVRESRDSDAHPNSLAVAIFLDETGSMRRIPENMVRNHLGTLMTSLVNHGLPDAQILFGALGDMHSDSFPLQIGQFESGDTELVKWLTNAILEGNGGGDMMESYLLAWLFAARHTSIDCWEKRQQKGVLFTIGDEASHREVRGSQLSKLLGYTESPVLTDKQLLAEAREKWHVFHIHVNEGSYSNEPRILDYWEKLLGMPPIVLHDQNNISEVIATTVGMLYGVDVNHITDSFAPKVAANVRTSLDYVINNYKI